MSEENAFASTKIKSASHKLGFHILNQPQLALSDYYLFPKMKKELLCKLIFYRCWSQGVGFCVF